MNTQKNNINSLANIKTKTDKISTKESYKKVKTTSLIIDLQNIDLTKFKQSYKLLKYKFPDYVEQDKRKYIKIHSWAYKNVNEAYYLNSNESAFYIICGKNQQSHKYIYEEKQLEAVEFDPFKSKDSASNFSELHILLKVLLSDYVKSKDRNISYFIDNIDFYIFIKMSNKHNAIVLKIKFSEYYKKVNGAYAVNNLNYGEEYEKELKIFNFEAGVTKLKKVSYEKYKEYGNKSLFRCEKIDKNYIFKKLNYSEIKALQNKESQTSAMDFFTVPNSNPNKKDKTREKYHSIKSAQELEQSISSTLEVFIDNYIVHLKTYHINAENRFLEMQKVLNGKFIKQDSKLNLKNLTINLLDLRCNKNTDLKKIISLFGKLENEVNLDIKTQDQLKPNDMVLLVMDYDKESYNYFFKDQEDPYQTLKQMGKDKAFVSQGLNVNLNLLNKSKKDKSQEPSYKNLSKDEFFNYKKPVQADIKDLKRNLQIGIFELILKYAIKFQTTARLPNRELLKNKVFYSMQEKKFLYLEDNKLKIIDETESVENSINLIEKVTGLNNLSSYIEKINKFNNPFGKNNKQYSNNNSVAENSNDTMGFIFSEKEILQIDKYKERHFYENDEIQQRLNERNRRRPKEYFIITNPTNEETIKNYNSVINDIVDEKNISYEELKNKYKKQIWQSLNYKEDANETKFVKLLSEKSQAKNLKTIKSGLFKTATGVWFAPKDMQYFVGKNKSYKYDQSSGFQMYKIIIHKGTFDPESYFSLMNVNFIRHEETTVLPYPFTIIRKSKDLL